MGSLPKVLASSVIRSAHQGQSHGGAACKKYCREAVGIYGLLQERLSDAEINLEAVKERLLRMQQDLEEMENHGLNSQSIQDTLAWEFCTWLSGGDFRPENIGKAQEFVGRLIEKTDWRNGPQEADLEEHFV